MKARLYDHAIGLSARAIQGHGVDHPRDPSDLRRCMTYCRFNGITSDALRQRMAGRSVEWDRLLDEWDALIELLVDELENRTDGLATRTYAAMKRVINAGQPCETCDSTGRGAECEKCKGTGRRSGGRCRARNCWWGADFCPTCRGDGYVDGDSPHNRRQAVQS